VARAWS